MGVTYTAIASSTVGSGGASSITFSSIPQTYTDLKVVMSARSDQTIATYDGDVYTIEFNSSTSNFSKTYLYGNGSSAISISTSNNLFGWIDPSNYTASTFGNLDIYISNYTGSTNKSFSIDSVTENNGTQAYCNFIACLWSNTAAITSITLKAYNASSKFVQYTTASLYGIKNS